MTSKRHITFAIEGFAQKMFFNPIFCARLLKSQCLLDSVIGGLQSKDI